MRNMKHGFTLIELLITIVLAAGGLMVLIQLMGVAIFADSNLEYSLLALNLANEKLEELKNIDYNSVVSATENSISGFDFVDGRIVTVNDGNDSGLKDVQVKVRWSQKGSQQSIQLRTYITDY
jgi:prepilin-type N-terminal cleavage/methylation domain-containing protein